MQAPASVEVASLLEASSAFVKRMSGLEEPSATKRTHKATKTDGELRKSPPFYGWRSDREGNMQNASFGRSKVLRRVLVKFKGCEHAFFCKQMCGCEATKR